ncbi:MAG: recombinase family protein [Clostridia bacterium]
MGKSFYGYMRVSSIDQNDERQRVELLKWGIVEKNIYADKLSGKDFNRPNYQRLRKKMQEGDVLVVKSIDRLGRNYEEIQNEWRYLVKEKRADIVIIDMPILDTRTNKDLIGTLISDIVLQLLSYVAQAEREYIRQRQAEGIAVAKANGVHLGRVANPLPVGFESCYQLWRGKAISFCQMAERLGITEVQLRWLVRKRNAEEASK